ncbi:hypothetical protein CC85DRAFT_287513 [Cutaneotrichosporon oleaginosum]|uniref:Rhodanese domain-containing protein n=1 Tax=Cutaneotrichosporon oleaginosum TaxID=879819 RepID=A0A0J0XH46_9TREE|nr:uncharacterized protein CC85DRAFT_287513 [Cutaneotrichosporon oleaginosum]KLT40411.1 hypothetical protein CC85DRAFT_287513 [Cutaneotrichosporon oleaginosum]TXT11376.1 hypothetical protein COLE_01786 [Cutaneotrichosporon oleaginosum]
MSWHAALPKPQSTPAEITVQDLAALQGTPGVDYIVVDVRRTDIIGDEDAARAMIPGALNLPAQTLYPTLATSGQLLKNIPKVVFHCNSCSAGGRGQRSAAWYQDWLDAQGVTSSQALVLKGGWKAWLAAFPDKVVKV